MTRAEILTLSQSLCFSKADADALAAYIDASLRDEALVDKPFSIKAEIVDLTSGTANYSFESDMIKVISMFYNGNLLSETDSRGLSAYNQTWPGDSGDPVAFTQDEITAHTYTLYPNPDTTSDPLIPVHGEPFGEDFPDNSLTLIYADKRDSDICELYGLPIAFDILNREFSRPSTHTDNAIAEVFGEVSNLFQSLLGV